MDLCQLIVLLMFKSSSFMSMVIFCYAYKIGIVTNGLGIVRHLEFYNKDFFIGPS